jgi:hypothetical protein
MDAYVLDEGGHAVSLVPIQGSAIMYATLLMLLSTVWPLLEYLLRVLYRSRSIGSRTLHRQGTFCER